MRLSPTPQNVSRSLSTSAATIVVPMPRVGLLFLAGLEDAAVGQLTAVTSRLAFIDRAGSKPKGQVRSRSPCVLARKVWIVSIGQLRRDLARLVATHPVGDHEHAVRHVPVQRVFIRWADAARMRDSVGCDHGERAAAAGLPTGARVILL